MLYGVNVTWVV